MNGDDVISEELLLSSVLVPKKRPPLLPLSTVDPGKPQEAIKAKGGLARESISSIDLAKETLPVAPKQADHRYRLKVLQDEFAQQKAIHDEALERAREAADAMQEILGEIASLNSVEFNPSAPQINGNEARRTLPPVSPVNRFEAKPSVPLAPSLPVSPPQPKPQLSVPQPSLPSISQSLLPPSNVIRVTSLQSAGKILPRKPRSLLFSHDLSDTMLTSTLDGSLQSWSLPKRAIEASVHFPSVLGQNVFPEDICLNHRSSHMAVALGESSKANESPVESYEAGCNAPLTYGFHSTSSAAELLTNRLYFMPVPFLATAKAPGILLEPASPVHTKSIVSMASFYDAASSDRSMFVTGGNDKALGLWDVNDNGLELKARPIHKRHTSAIHAIAQQLHSRNVWSGGNDCRLVGCNLGTGQVFSDRRLNDRITQLLAHACHPATLLMAQAKMNDQLSLLDIRLPLNTMRPVAFGWPEAANLTRYLRPSWHPDGHLIACGASQPCARYSGIMLWDTRFIGEQRKAPLQIIDVQTDKRLLRTEFHPVKSTLVALTSDASLSFLEYSIV